MRSGNGRHRRPRQAPALVVAAGVTGSALALPLLAATNASAADTATWDKVAECESGGTWSADLGNGFYGGLQFTQELWKSAGGLEYAPRADLASRSQQIAVAEKVLATKGPTAWPLCAGPSGLTKGGPKAEVDDGLNDGGKEVAPAPVRPDERPTPEPPAAQGAPGTSGSGTKSPTAPATPGTTAPSAPGTRTAPSTPGTPETPAGSIPGATRESPEATVETPEVPGASTTPGTTPGTPGATPGTPDPSTGTPDATAETPGTGKHRGDAADEESGDESDVTGRHASNGAPEADEPSGTEATQTGSKPVEDPTYTVKAGDNLWEIADAKKVKGGWSALYKANEQVIGGDADLIKPGQNLDLSEK
ncbi:transglycosylase family protein [Streptomyces sp. NPDC089919]|uniref:transglycosylase family protein n=1 Tax=Streptomyces sp. NPDC089919 TaxID=3155188 RepID=UPI003422FAAA